MKPILRDLLRFLLSAVLIAGGAAWMALMGHLWGADLKTLPVTLQWIAFTFVLCAPGLILMCIGGWVSIRIGYK